MRVLRRQILGLLVLIIASVVALSKLPGSKARNTIFEASKWSLRALGTSVTADYEENVMNTYGRYKMTISHGKGCRL